MTNVATVPEGAIGRTAQHSRVRPIPGVPLVQPFVAGSPAIHSSTRSANAVFVSPFGKCFMLSASVGQFANTWSEFGSDT